VQARFTILPVLLLLAALLTFRPLDTGLPQSGMWRHGFAVADMNGDGTPDLVFTSPRKEPGPPAIFLNDGRGTFARWEQATFPPLGFDYGAVAAADFDASGTMDLAVAVHYRGVTVLLGDGRGAFTAASADFPWPSAFSSRALTVTDWNGDGHPDVAAVSDGPRPLTTVQMGVTVFENAGASWTAKRATVADPIHGDTIVAGDVDGDGLVDLLTASQNAGDQRVLRLGSDGGLKGRRLDTSNPTSLVHAMEFADLDRDGRHEVIVGYQSGTPATSALELLSFPTGSRPPTTLWSAQNAAVPAIASGDVDGDDRTDVVAALNSGRILVFRGDGNGALMPPVEIALPGDRRGCTPYAIRVADLNADGRAEVIAALAGETACAGNGAISVWQSVTLPALRRRSVGR
jgi:hypothetical protein